MCSNLAPSITGLFVSLPIFLPVRLSVCLYVYLTADWLAVWLSKLLNDMWLHFSMTVCLSDGLTVPDQDRTAPDQNRVLRSPVRQTVCLTDSVCVSSVFCLCFWLADRPIVCLHAVLGQLFQIRISTSSWRFLWNTFCLSVLNWLGLKFKP